MKLKYLLLSATLFAATAAIAQQKQAKIDTIFFEDFNEQTLDRSKWNVEVTGHTVNDEQQAYVDSVSTIYFDSSSNSGAVNGALVLQPHYQPGFTTKQQRKYDFISGRINTQSKME